MALSSKLSSHLPAEVRGAACHRPTDKPLYRAAYADNTPIAPLAACSVTPPLYVRDPEIQPRLAICTNQAGALESVETAAKTAPLDARPYDFDRFIQT